MNRRLLLPIMVLILANCALPAMSQKLLPLKKNKSFAQELKTSTFLVPWKEQMQALENFRKALRTGDVNTVKKLEKAYPYKNFLTMPVPSKKGEYVSPVCVAVENGSTDLAKYMIQKKPALLKVTCKDRTLLDVALSNKQAGTAVMLLNSNLTETETMEPLFVQTEQTFKDTASLKALIPALLDANVNYRAISWSSRAASPDALYSAAKDKNTNFITVLRDELKGRNQPLVANYILWSCPGYSEQDKKDWKAEVDKSEEGRLLKKYGISIRADIQTTFDGCD